MTNWEIVNDDVLHWAKTYTGKPFMAMLCDPPYHLTSGHSATGGFMNAAWDGEASGKGIAFRPETWAALAEHLYPGAFVFAFGSCRTYHRLACALEDAGLRLHSAIGWVFGCLSDDTEILTDEGWKSYQDDLTDSMIMCYNVASETFAYMPVQEVFEYEISDTVYSICSDSTDQIVTGGHRCLVEQGGMLVFKQASALQLEETIPILESDALCQQQPTQKIRGSWRTATTLATVTPIHYEGTVWCVRVPTGAFVARRNGHIFVTGNSGFPKATRIDTQIDAAAGAEGCRTRKTYGDGKQYHPTPNRTNPNPMDWETKEQDRFTEYNAFTPLARAWKGHRYGLQALKPALELIAVAQKPYEGRPVDSITVTGAGALNVDKGRVGLQDGETTWGNGRSQSASPVTSFGDMKEKRIGVPNIHSTQGRWPPNLALVHSSLPVMQLRGITSSKIETQTCEASRGTCTRFYPNHDWSYEIAERLATCAPVRYCAKASRRERDSGLTVPNVYGTIKPTQEEASQWENAGRNPIIQPELDIQLGKDTIDLPSGIPKPSRPEWSLPTSGPGNRPTSQSRQGIVFTTKTGTGKITDLKISNLLTSQPTDVCTEAVNSEMVSGGSPVKSVESSSQLTKNIGTCQKKAGPSMDAAESAISEKSLNINKGAGQDKRSREAANRVGPRNPHPT